ncbi:MAG: hypothetical protein JSV52_04635 [Candidatus Zixiibacteriota bacterium]|nr:MAG: hypothetical protein JSV52_04635 [candidate division Zixibacteria bacterium]
MGNKETSGKQSSSGDRQLSTRQLNSYVLTLPFLAVVVLHLIGWLFPGRMTWGFDFWSLVSPGVAAAVFLAAVVLLIPPVTEWAAKILAEVGRFYKRVGVTNKLVLFAFVSILMGGVFYFFRVRALVYGDGYTLVSDITDSESFTFHFQYKFQILAVYFYRYVCPIISDHLSISIEKAYALINAVGGVAGLWAIVRISGQITSSQTSRAFVLLGALSSASVILFFGYVENYTWATALSLWTLSFAISYSQFRTGLVGMVILGPLAFMLHMITFPFLLAALLALFMRGSPAGNHLFGLRLRSVNIGIASGSVLLVVLTQLYDIDIFVRVWPVETNPYWVFSAAHFTDVINELVLVAGLGLGLLFLVRWYGRRHVFAVGTVDGVLGTVTMLTLLVAFWIDPGIGAPRDWDLLSLVGFPLSIWACYRFTKLFPLREVPVRWIVPAVVVLGVHLGANLYEKQHSDLAVSHVDGHLSNDVHYRPEYKQARHCGSWAAILANEVNRSDLAIKYLTRQVDVSYEFYKACFGLGDIYSQQQEYDSAAKYLELGLAASPNELRFLVNLAKVERARKRYNSAIKWGLRAEALAPNNTDILTEIGISLGFCDRFGEALDYFRRAYEQSPSTYSQILNLGLCYGRVGMSDSAYFYVNAALPLAPEETRVDLYGYIIRAAIDWGKIDEAARHLEELRRTAPTAPTLPALEARLAEARKGK